MMFVESTMAIRFPSGTHLRSASVPHFRSMWNPDEVNGILHVTSCRLSCAAAASFHMPWRALRKLKGTASNNRSGVVKNKIQASAEHLGSAPDPIKPNGKPAYHPSEDISKFTSDNIADATLTPAETSRTIVEINSKATLMFSSLINDEGHENIILPDLPYLTDGRGNLYFHVKNDEDMLRSIASEQNFVQVIVGIDTMEMMSELDLSALSDSDLETEVLDDEDEDIDEDIDEDDSDDEDDEEDYDDYDSDWVTVLDDDGEQDDSDDSIRDWTNLDTMRSSHPMDFAKRLAEVASDDQIDWMEQPPSSVSIQGLVRPAFVEEHSLIQKCLSDNQSSNSGEYQHGNVVEDRREDSLIHDHKTLDDNVLHAEKTDNHDSPINGTLFYKLEMIKMHLFSATGHPTLVEVEDYFKAQPDAIIANSSAKIISRFEAGGEKISRALQSLCWRCKGIQVEEAAIIGIDSLGFDLRVCSGTQVQTLRFAFLKRATSEGIAERQLSDLLFPKTHQTIENS